MGLSREPYGCVRLHDSACLLISENILQFERLDRNFTPVSGNFDRVFKYAVHNRQ